MGNTPPIWIPTLQRIRNSLPPCVAPSTLWQMYADAHDPRAGIWTPDGIEDYWLRTLLPVISSPSWFPGRKKQLGFG